MAVVGINETRGDLYLSAATAFRIRFLSSFGIMLPPHAFLTSPEGR